MGEKTESTRATCISDTTKHTKLRSDQRNNSQKICEFAKEHPGESETWEEKKAISRDRERERDGKEKQAGQTTRGRTSERVANEREAGERARDWARTAPRPNAENAHTCKRQVQDPQKWWPERPNCFDCTLKARDESGPAAQSAEKKAERSGKTQLALKI